MSKKQKNMQHSKYDLLESIYLKYEEHLEMAGEYKPALVIRILTSLLYEEKQLNEYYKKVLKGLK